MLARDDEEFEMYQEFDRMRYDEEKQIYANFEYGVNYRLMPESEVPEYVKIKEEKKKKVLGKRRDYRKFYDVVPDFDETSEEEKKARKKASQKLKRKKRAKSKAKKNKNMSKSRGKNEVNMKNQEIMKMNLSKKNPSESRNNHVEEKDDIFVDSDD
jgi:ATP-dependent helicase STH1/SNF2